MCRKREIKIFHINCKKEKKFLSYDTMMSITDHGIQDYHVKIQCIVTLSCDESEFLFSKVGSFFISFFFFLKEARL